MKKIIFILFLVILSFSNVYAMDTCYYKGDGFAASFDVDDNEIYVDMIGDAMDHDSEELSNYCDDLGGAFGSRINTTESGHTFSDYQDEYCVSSDSLGYCPEYLVFQYCNVYRVWATQSLSEAKQVAADIDKIKGCVGKYGSYKDEDGKRITAEAYYHGFVKQELVGSKIPKGKECESIFGDVNDEATPSLAYIINEILTYVRIIVPMLLIILGTIDLAKAMTASKEDEIKKARDTFVKRIIIGVVVFFVPAIVNVIMWIADIVWQGLDYSRCNLPL